MTMNSRCPAGNGADGMAMTTRQLYELLQQVPDTREIVVRLDEDDTAGRDGLLAAWRAAHDEATAALAAWRASPGRDAFARYRAAEDRADAALAAFAAQ
jgi:hypothetical protein